MRNALFYIFFTIICFASFHSCTTDGASISTGSAEDDFVALVNGSPIKYAEFKQELDSTYMRFHESGQLVDGLMYEQLKEEILESLINLRLLYQHSQAKGIRIDDGEVESYYQAKVAQYPSAHDYTTSIKEAGLTDADIKMRIRRTLGTQKFVEEHVAPKATVTDAEVKAYYEANPNEFEHDVLVHAAHILIKVSPWADKQIRRKAKEKLVNIRAQIEAGADFAEMAKEYSEGPSKANGGDLGYFGYAQMSPTFETAAFALRPGEISKVVTTQFGYHLIKVYDRKPAGRETLEEAAPILKSRFQKERLDNHLRQVVDQLKTKANIERFEIKEAN
jgi:peptidyl-prolyl cis-trans isomerase C